MREEALEELLQKWKPYEKLRCLKIGRKPIREDTGFLAKKMLRWTAASMVPYLENIPQTVSQCCPNLEYLDLSHIYSINDWSLDEVFTKCPKLTYLNLEGCVEVDETLYKRAPARVKINKV